MFIYNLKTGNICETANILMVIEEIFWSKQNKYALNALVESPDLDLAVSAVWLEQKTIFS